MVWFDNLRIKAKLLLAFGVVVALGAATGGFAIVRLASVNDKSTEIATNWLPSVEAVSALWAQAAELRGLQFRHVLTTTPDGMSQVEALIDAKRGQLDKTHADYVKLISSPQEQGIADEFKRRWDAYLKHWEGVLALSRVNRNTEATAAMTGEGQALYDRAAGSLGELVKLNHDGGVAASDAGDAEYASARFLILLALAFSTLGGLALALLVSGRIASVLTRVTTIAQGIAKGRLDREVESTSTDEVGQVASALNGIVQSQRELTHTAKRIAAGDTGVSVTVRSEGDELNHAFLSMRDALAAITGEMGTLSQAAFEGRLDARGNELRFQGSFRELVAGMNRTLDAIAAPLTEIGDVMRRAAERDVTERVTKSYPGAFGELSQAVNVAVTNLDQAMMQVQSAADQVAASAGEITSASQALAEGATEQAASLEEVSASVHLFTSITQQSAGNANEASSLAAAARSDAVEGATRMARLTEAVEEIRKASSDTAKIIKTIDEIAFQTNLLALNAAVEAARAGEAGRGFAVVAEEVRALALRAAEAARQTSSLIEQGSVSAERGVALNGEVLQSFTHISGRIEKITYAMAEISSAATQQVDGAAQIRGALEQINTVTQGVAASAEEAASAAKELDSQAQAMRETVGAFNLSTLPAAGVTRGHGRSLAPRPFRATTAAPSATRRAMAAVG